MAGKTKDMSQIKQILLLKKQNVSNRKIAGIVGMNKETVNNYVNKAKSDTLSLDELLALEDPVLEHRMKGGNAAGQSQDGSRQSRNRRRRTKECS